MDAEAIFIASMSEIVRQCHQNSKNKGFWDEGEQEERYVCDEAGNIASRIVKTKPWNFGEKMMLIVSELSEWFESHRKRTTTEPCDKDIMILDGGVSRRLTNQEEEAADTFIRLGDLCGKLGIDLGRAVLAKMQYNAGRPHMHGRTC